MLERVAVAERLVLVSDELGNEEIDVTRKDSDVLVDAKVQKLWARVSAVGSSFCHRETTQSVSPVVNTVLGQKQFTSATLEQFASAIDSCKQFVTQVEYPLRLGSSADSVELALRLMLLLELVLLIIVELELVVVPLLIVVAVELPALILVVVGDCPWTATTKQS